MDPRDSQRLLKARARWQEAEKIAREELVKVIEDLLGKEISQAAIARELGISRQSLSEFINL